jgi:stage II sporulation protein D
MSKDSFAREYGQSPAVLPVHQWSEETVRKIDGRPIIRVNLLEGYDKVDFRVEGPFSVMDLKGDPIFANITSELMWRSRVEHSRGGQFIYSILLTAFRQRDLAMELLRHLESKGHHGYIRRLGYPLEIDGKVVSDNTKYRVLAGNFLTDADARKSLSTFSDDFAPRVIREKIHPPVGQLEVYDAEYDRSATVKDGFRVVPHSADSITTLYGVRVGTGFHYEKQEDRKYRGIMEIRLDNEGMLQAISEVSLDIYLKGVVSSDIPANFPKEALMAQAIASRSEVLAKLGTKHLNDPFDLCATVHCQVYSGITDENPQTNDIVEATFGKVLVFEDNICDAVSNPVCGGHTENKENVWNPPAEKYLTGFFDGDPGDEDLKKLDLTKEKDVTAWIKVSPPMYCNPKGKEAIFTSEHQHRYFRWEIAYSRQELQEIILKKTGEDIGTLYDIIPLQRGVSGRLIEIEILGSRKNLKIKKELNIRRALSETELKSSCFIVETELGEMGNPVSVTLRGAGWGHGVGMCQYGAAAMASEGIAHKEILQHYYPGSSITLLYHVDPEIKPKSTKKPKAK